MPELRLYFAPGTCARVPLIALEEIGVPFDALLVRMIAGEHKSPAYLALNPKGKVPTLLIEGQPLTENVAILTFLAQSFPQAKLLPSRASGLEQAQVMADLAWCSSTLHPIVSRLRVPFIVAEGPAAIASVWKLAADAMAPNFALIDRRLENREWVLGEWSVVDAFLFWIWTQAEESGLDVEPYRNFAAHTSRMRQRPSVQRALARESEAFALLESEGLMPRFPPIPKAG